MLTTAYTRVSPRVPQIENFRETSPASRPVRALESGPPGVQNQQSRAFVDHVGRSLLCSSCRVTAAAVSYWVVW